LSFFFFCPLVPILLFTLSLHDALPICYICNYEFMESLTVYSVSPAGGYRSRMRLHPPCAYPHPDGLDSRSDRGADHTEQGEVRRSEEHTSELQSRENLVCRLLLEKKKT